MQAHVAQPRRDKTVAWLSLSLFLSLSLSLALPLSPPPSLPRSLSLTPSLKMPLPHTLTEDGGAAGAAQHAGARGPEGVQPRAAAIGVPRS